MQTISLVDMLQVAKRASRSAWSVLVHHGVVVIGNSAGTLLVERRSPVSRVWLSDSWECPTHL